MVKNPPANVGDVDSIPGWDDPLEEEMATYSSILAWEFQYLFILFQFGTVNIVPIQKIV